MRYTIVRDPTKLHRWIGYINGVNFQRATAARGYVEFTGTTRQRVISRMEYALGVK